jgi:putative aminopeptidase FrvX
MIMKLIIEQLSQADGPPGFETQVRNLVNEAVEPLADELRVDSLGNLIARKGRRSKVGLKIMLTAHMDEVGLIVTHIDKHGFARFIPLGPLSPYAALEGRVRFLNGARGIISAEYRSDQKKLPSFDQMFIDLGAKDAKTCPAKVGDMGVLEQQFQEIGGNLVGKALNDRVGIALLIEALRQLDEKSFETPHELFFVFSAQELIGSRGGSVAAFGIDPDISLAVDLTPSGGTPAGPRISVETGQGPAIKVRDSYMISDPKLVDWMVRTAEEKDLPYQLEVLKPGREPGNPIQLSRAGVTSGGISLPARYLNSSSEMVCYRDVEIGLLLLTALLQQPIEVS